MFIRVLISFINGVTRLQNEYRRTWLFTYKNVFIILYFFLINIIFRETDCNNIKYVFFVPTKIVTIFRILKILNQK